MAEGLEEHQRRLLRRACRSLLPGGRLVVKDAMGSSRWKRSLSRAQEQVAVRLVRMTSSAEGVHPPPEADAVAALLAGEGLEVRIVSLDAGYHAPHLAVVGERTAN